MTKLISGALTLLILVGCSNLDRAPISVEQLLNDEEFQQDSQPRHASFSFVVIGCNRVDAADVSEDNPSTANTEQLLRTFREIAQLRPLPEFLFFAGDMVFGYTSDAQVVERQLVAWRALYESSPLPDLGVQLVAIPGNHEVQDGPASPHFAYRAAEEVWLRVMAPYIWGANGPAAGGDDALETDQSMLTYSFDHLGSHFVILNTDPVGRDWTVPTRWVAQDIAAAVNAQARHIFAIGHKPAFPWPEVPLDGLSRDEMRRDEFWSSMEVNRAEAMFSAHNHLWFKQRPHADGTWMVIAGNGGSKLETGVPVDDQYYGFTWVRIGRRSRVVALSFGRDVPAEGYLAASDAYPTSVRDWVDVTWRRHEQHHQDERN